MDSIPPILSEALLAARPFLPLFFICLIGTFSYTVALGGGPLAVPDKHQRKASATDAKRGSVFGAAAEENIVFTPEEAGAGSKESDVSNTASDSRYAVVKHTCHALDYTLIFALWSYNNENFTGDNFTPQAAVKMYVMQYGALVLMDIFKAIIFRDVVPKAKTNHMVKLGKEFVGLFSPSGAIQIVKFLGKLATGQGTIFNFKDKGSQRRGVLYHIFYMVKIGLLLAGGFMFSAAYMGNTRMDPILGTAYEIELPGVADFVIPVPNLVNNYMIFLFMSFFKDAVCMNILHQVMHRRFYEHHYVHHLPMKEVSLVNFTFFDVMDAILEQLIGPLFVLMLKYCMDPTTTPVIDITAILLMTFSDFSTHSTCPYTVGFYFPPIDSLMSPVVSHSLHHALNTGHYTIWPLHQLKGIMQYDSRSKTNIDGSLKNDWMAYNRVFKTNFPEGREDK